MISITIEAPQPLLEYEKFSEEDSKPLYFYYVNPTKRWRIKKLALSKCYQTNCVETPKRKISHDLDSKPLYENTEISEQIPIKYKTNIVDKRFSERIIYESYKPHNLRSMLDYMHFSLVFRSTIPNPKNILKKYSTEALSDISPINNTDEGDIHKAMAVDDILTSPEISPEIKSYYNSDTQTKLPEQLDQSKILVFDSNFESGNLDRVSIISLSEYNLFLNPDTNTKGHSQWFYFAVTNTYKDKTVIFNILNCTKPVGLFKAGMRPMVFSEIEFENNGIDWVPDTFNVIYGRGDIPRDPPKPDANEDSKNENAQNTFVNTLYTLTFSHTFKNSGDRVYFAYSRPYTLGMHFLLLKDLQQTIMRKPKHFAILEEDGLKKRIKQFINSNLNTTTQNNPSINQADQSNKKNYEESQLKLKNKKSYRNPSLNIQQKMPIESPFAPVDVLRKYQDSGQKPDKFIWMKTHDFQAETEDGIIYRQETLCRSFCGIPIPIITITNSNSKKHPLAKRKIIVITARVHAAEASGSFKVEGILRFLISNAGPAFLLRELYIFKIVPMLNPEGVLCGNFRCSLSGTDLNRRWDQPDETLHPQVYYLKNLFKKLLKEDKEILVYCDLHGHSRKNNAFMYGCNKAANGGFCSWTKVRLLPRIIATKTPIFSYKDCKFRVEGSKQRTARVVVWKEFGVTNSFTLESSFYGYYRGKEIAQFEPKNYYELGSALLESFVEYYYVLKSLEKEFIITKGWLKPSRLLAVTGNLAADVLAQKITKEKEEQRRKKRAQLINEKNKKRKENERKFRKKSKHSPDKFIRKVDRSLSKSKELPRLNIVHKRGESLQLKDDSSPYLPTITQKQNTVNFTDAAYLAYETQNGEGSPFSGDTVSLNVNKLQDFNSKDAIGNPSDNSENENDQSPIELKKEWRKYFAEEELNAAYAQINNGVDPNENEENSENSVCGSDSNPSDDNLETEEMTDFYKFLPGSVFLPK